MILGILAAAAIGHGKGPNGELARMTLANLESKARFEHKNVLVIFHASWCGWCKKLEGFISSRQFGNFFLANYELDYVDVSENKDKKSLETAGGAELAERFGATSQGIPFFVAVTPRNTVIMDSRSNGANIGYPGTADEIAYFMAFLKATAPNAKPDQLNSIQSYLTSKS